MHILSPETDNCPSWISGRERMTVENVSWSISTKECYRPRRGLNPRPSGLQSDGASNWATEAGTIMYVYWKIFVHYARASSHIHINLCSAEPGYVLPLQTVKIQISWLLKKPTDLDLHCLPFGTWICINNPDQVNWLAENEKLVWHLNLFSMTRVELKHALGLIIRWKLMIIFSYF